MSTEIPERALWTARSAPTLPPDHPPDATLRRSLSEIIPTRPEALPRISFGDELAPPEGPPGELRLDALLGEGGMGKVYAATQRSLGRGVAVKVLDDDDPSRRAALLHEARITGRLEHPNIVPVHLLGLDARGLPVLVMKRIEGASWRELLRDPSHPAWSTLESRHRDRLEAQVSVLLSVCDALEYAHARRIVHRDIKPENVMLGPFGEVYLLDWGVAFDLAAPQGDRAVIGTPAYMAPEMAEGDLAHITERTDVYLLGATLHEVLAGVPPHRGDTLHAVMLAALMSDPPELPADAPVELAALCTSALARDPAHRPDTVRAFREGLLAWSRHRASVTLSNEAWVALRALQLDASGGSAERALVCRYRFARALSDWPENADARDGLREVLGVLADHALSLRDLDGARAFVDEIAGGDEARRAAVEALAVSLQEAREQEARASAVQREMDLTAWMRGRPWVFLFLVGSIFVLGLWVSSNRGRGAAADEFVPLVLGDLLVTVVILVALRIAHRAAVANEVGRRIAAVLVLSALWVLAFDVLAWRMGLSVAFASAHKLLALAALHAFSAASGLHALRWVGALALVCAALVVAVPERVYAITPVSFAALTGALWYLARSGRLRSADALR